VVEFSPVWAGSPVNHRSDRGIAQNEAAGETKEAAPPKD